MPITAVLPTTPFKPTSITGCQLWLDAADQTTMTGTTTLTAWKDKSANAYTATSFVNSVAYPSWVSNVQNGNGVVQYSTGNGASIPNFVLAQTMSIFMVYYPINQSTDGPFLEHGTDENTSSGLYFHAQNGNNFAINNGSGQIYVNYGTTAVSNTWQMIEGINPDPSNTNTMAFYVNGTTRASGSTQSGTTTLTKTLYINGRAGTTLLSYNTYLAELIIYNTALTATQRQQIEGYLAWKWGLQANLVSGHPYIAAAPTVSASFAPTSIPGCALWLDSSDSTTITLSSSSVTAWNDKSGNGYSAVKNNSLSYPTYNSSGTKYVQFQPSQALRISNFSYTSSWSVFICMNNVTLAPRYMISVYGTIGLVLMSMNEGPNKIWASYLSSAPADITGTHIENTNSSTAWYRDGTVLATGGGVGIAGSASTPLGIGANASGDNDMGGTYNVYEILMYSSVLTTTQRQQIEGYLAWKWGTQASLPGGHPYASTNPNPTINNKISALPYYTQFSPTSIAGCQIWVDATDSSRINLSGSSVTSYTEKARGLTLTTQGTVANLTVVSNKINGLPTLYFNNVSGNNAVLTSATNLFSGTSTFTFFVVWTHAPQRTSWTSIVNVTRGGGAGAQLGVSSDSLFYYTGNGATTGGYIALTQGTAYMAYYTATGTVSALSIFGNSPTVGTQTNVGTAGTSDYMTIAGETGLNTTNTLFLGELIFYNTALTTTQRQQVESYLAQKWGLTSQMPTFSGPTAISGCQLWLDGADSSSMVFSSGSNITTWKDKSGLANNATAANGSPVFTPNSLNGNASIYLSNAPCFRGSISITGTTYTAFVVAVTPSIPNTLGHDQRLLSFAVNSTGADYNTTSASIGFFNWVQGTDGVGTKLITYRNAVIGSNVISANVPFMGSALYNGANGYLWVNGTAATTTGTASSGNFGISVYGVGDHASNVGGEYWNGYIGEVIVYNTALTTLQQQKIEGYLANKWNLNSNLPTTHPYYTGPPNHLHFTVPTGRDPIIAALVPTIPKGIIGYSPTISSGGTVTLNGLYRVHTFTTVGTSTFTLSGPPSVQAQLLVVGGGGAGGGYNDGGGGGAGGLVYLSPVTLTAGTYSIVVGAGGTGTTAYAVGGNGGNSSAFGYIGLGGGGGGADTGIAGAAGGCGGGGGYSTAGGAATQAGGFAGGRGTNGDGGTGAAAGAGGSTTGGGGGGMGSAGTNLVGGSGLQYSISGTAKFYAAGGGAGTDSASVRPLGGSGIGGNGGYRLNTATNEPTSGAPNTGSGGGALSQSLGGFTSGAGGSGIVIISFLN